MAGAQAKKQGMKAQPQASAATARVILPAAVLALTVIGLVMVYSTTSVSLVSEGESPYSGVISQAIYAALGLLAGVFVWRFLPYRIWAGNLTWTIWFICIALILLTALFGTEVNGARRWLYIGPIGMQPSELLKISLLLMAIKIMNEVRDGTVEVKAGLAQGFLFVLLPLGFLYLTQSDLGTTLICAVGVFAILWLAGVPGRLLGLILVFAAIAVFLAVFVVGYRSDRLVYLNPWNDGQDGYGAGYNIIRSFYAISDGGIFGVGLGNSHEKFDYLFASDSDFIFAVICEEGGLIGALVVIALFLVVLFAGLKIAETAPDELGAMIAGGFTIMLVFQAFLNIGCTIGVFPTTGKPLPFISAGGTSIVASLIMMGLVMSVSVSEKQDVYERNRENLRVVRGGRR